LRSGSPGVECDASGFRHGPGPLGGPSSEPPHADPAYAGTSGCRHGCLRVVREPSRPHAGTPEGICGVSQVACVEPSGVSQRQSTPVRGAIRGIATPLDSRAWGHQGCRSASRLPCAGPSGVSQRQSTPVREGIRGIAAPVDSRARGHQGCRSASRLPCVTLRGVVRGYRIPRERRREGGAVADGAARGALLVRRTRMPAKRAAAVTTGVSTIRSRGGAVVRPVVWRRVRR
jgi:hypothetical protein